MILFISELFTDIPPTKLDPDNHKTIPQLQEEAAEAKRESASSKATTTVAKNGSRKRKRSDETDEDEDSDDISIEFEQNHAQAESSRRPKDTDSAPTPMPVGGSIVDLRNKLHDKIATFQKRRGLQDETFVESKDSILEARRLRRAELRENRRKETREKKRAKREGKDSGGHKSGNASRVGVLIRCRGWLTDVRFGM